MRIFILITLLLSGCASNTVPPTVEENIFISQYVPKLMVRVSDDIPYIKAAKINTTGTDESGSLASTGVTADRYLFGNESKKKALIISIDRLSSTTFGRWYLEPPDYSAIPGIITLGEQTLNGDMYSTAIHTQSKNNNHILIKLYGKVLGVGDDYRLQIAYIEQLSKALDISSDTNSSLSGSTQKRVEEFSERADTSFTVLPFDEAALNQMLLGKADNEYLKENINQKDDAACDNSLSCAKGYFCVNNKCRKGFTTQ